MSTVAVVVVHFPEGVVLVDHCVEHAKYRRLCRGCRAARRAGRRVPPPARRASDPLDTVLVPTAEDPFVEPIRMEDAAGTAAEDRMWGLTEQPRAATEPAVAETAPGSGGQWLGGDWSGRHGSGGHESAGQSWSGESAARSSGADAGSWSPTTWGSAPVSFGDGGGSGGASGGGSGGSSDGGSGGGSAGGWD